MRKFLIHMNFIRFPEQKEPKKNLQNLSFNFRKEILQSVNVTGDSISFSKNLRSCFVAKASENCRYCEYITSDKDSYDVAMSGEMQECYEGVVVDHSQMNHWGLFSVKSQDVRYTQHCHSSKHLFGCVGLRNSSYSILNKQYTREEYEELTEKIITHMNDMLYKDKKGNMYKYGEFYPAELSPFGYNETLAMENFPLTKEEALSSGYKWQEHIQRTIGKETIKTEDIPESINDVDESILDEVLACGECNRNYKIVPNELIFYKKMFIPVPRKCFHCRHTARLKLRHPFKLWHGKCMCENVTHNNHTGPCGVEFETTYSPERAETIYCEKCYQQEVY